MSSILALKNGKMLFKVCLVAGIRKEMRICSPALSVVLVLIGQFQSSLTGGWQSSKA